MLRAPANEFSLTRIALGTRPAQRQILYMQPSACDLLGGARTANMITKLQILGVLAFLNASLAPGAELVFQQVAAGDSHTVALKSDGTLWAWGGNNSGQLGDGTTVEQIQPGANWARRPTGRRWRREVTTRWRSKPTARSGLGATTAMASWGMGRRSNKSSPVQVGTATNWQAVAAGCRHTVALKSDGTLWAWGDNWLWPVGGWDDGQQIQPGAGGHGDQLAGGGGGMVTTRWRSRATARSGPGATTRMASWGMARRRTNPARCRVGTATNWQAVAAGGSHTVALKSDGTLWAWGDNYYGQLGDGTTANKIQPGAGGHGDQLAVGGGGRFSHGGGQERRHALGLGQQCDGQLGDGTTANKSSPVQVGTATNWQSVAAG